MVRFADLFLLPFLPSSDLYNLFVILFFHLIFSHGLVNAKCLLLLVAQVSLSGPSWTRPPAVVTLPHPSMLRTLPLVHAGSHIPTKPLLLSLRHENLPSS